VLREVLAGRDVATVETMARDFVADLVLRRVRPDCLRRWQWHRAQGHHLILASASLGLYLHQLGALLGADAVLSTEMESSAGRLTGELATPNCRGAEKARRLDRHLTAHPATRVWVYANGSADRPIRALADVAVQVRPFRALSRAAR
jgi:phosphatidylglycerophosphatase C